MWAGSVTRKDLTQRRKQLTVDAKVEGLLTIAVPVSASSFREKIAPNKGSE